MRLVHLGWLRTVIGIRFSSTRFTSTTWTSGAQRCFRIWPFLLALVFSSPPTTRTSGMTPLFSTAELSNPPLQTDERVGRFARSPVRR